MKLLALLIVFLIATSAMGKINRINKHAGRTTSPEAVALTVIYLGTCDQFQTVRPSVAISALPASGCLPVTNAAGFATTDDLIADVLCTNIGRNKAQIDFVEIYQTVESVPFTGPYSISFTPNAPFKALASGVTYLRRPSCTTQKDYCSATNYVLNCAESPVVLKNGFVISNDEVFVLVRATAVGCGQAINTCCAYVNSVFCPRNASSALLNFNWDSLNHHEEHHEHHEEHHNSYDNGHNGHNNGHNNHHNDHDDDNDDDDNDHDDHHNNHNSYGNNGNNGHNNGHNGHNNGNNGHNNGNNGHNNGNNGHNNGNNGHNNGNNGNNGHHGHKNEAENKAVNNAVEADEEDDKKK